MRRIVLTATAAVALLGERTLVLAQPQALQ